MPGGKGGVGGGSVTDKGKLDGGRLVGWESRLGFDMETPPGKRGISLIAMSDQDAVLDLPPFEKVGRKL